MEPTKNSLTSKLEPKSQAFLDSQQVNIDMIGFTVEDFSAQVNQYNEQLRKLDGIEAQKEIPNFDPDATEFKPLPAHRTAPKTSLLARFEDAERLLLMEDVPMANKEKFQLVANQMADMNDGEIFIFLGKMRFSDNPNEQITDAQRTELEAAIKKAKSEVGSFFGRKIRPDVAVSE